MDGAREQRRLRELFDRASVLSNDERAAFVAQLSGDDRALIGELDSLLLHHDRASQFLAEPLPSIDPLARAAPERIGSYRIVHELGRGGMGVVYLAEQERPRRRVALKVIQPGVVTPAALRRFEFEAQVLARLQHVGIAQIYEAGSADWGFGPQPYFALEYVEGPTLSAFVAASAVGARTRIELIVQIADALEHAHRRGVIHRDLKPSNVLVSSAGDGAQVKLLDFGVARVTDVDVRATSLRTDVGQVIGTLAYMSPEQASGDPEQIDERCDVYSLGVIGYEMLTATLPIEVVGQPLHEALRRVREQEPTPLSRRVRVLRGDLDTIFAKALEKDPARRYATASEFAEDLRRSVDDRPIRAKPPSRAYVVAKFARRNRALVAGAVGVFAAIAIGFVTTWRERTLADREARRARAIARFQREMLSRVAPELDGRDVKLATVLDAAALSLPGDLSDDPAAEGGVRATLGESYQALGMLTEAERELSRASELLSASLGAEHVDTLRVRAWLATVAADRGDMAGAIRATESALDGMRRTLGSSDREVLILELNLADLYASAGRLEEAERIARANAAARRALWGERDGMYLNALARLGQLAQLGGRLDEAETSLSTALELGRAVQGEQHIDTLHYAALLAGVEVDAGKLDEAVRLLENCVERGAALLGPEHFEVLAWQHNLAAVYERRGDLAEAERLFRIVAKSSERALGPNHPDAIVVAENLAHLLARQGRFDEALPLFERAYEARRRDEATDPAALEAARQRVEAARKRATPRGEGDG